MIEAVRKVFHRGQPDEKAALGGIDLHLSAGDFGVIIGSNGAGKSTLLNAIAGVTLPDEGRILINGSDVTRLPVHRRAGRVSRVFQDPMRGTAATMTVAENMMLAELRGRPKRLRRSLDKRRRMAYQERLAILGLGLESRLDTRVDLLSGGQRQSLSLVMAVWGEPDILLLDEHTAALDPRTANIVLTATAQAVAAQRLTTLMVTHNMQHALDYGNRIIMMDRGRVVRQLGQEEKSRATVADLVQHFAVKSDWMLLS